MENYRNELMQDQNFIRCSVLIAELLLKYKTKESEIAEASGESKGSPELGDTYGHLMFSVSSLIIPSLTVKKRKSLILRAFALVFYLQKCGYKLLLFNEF